uniref:Si:ch211-59c24.3 n=1 Tax=Tetraodon nigroviridis TaxID=99883 RepID=H3C9D2_TETNG
VNGLQEPSLAKRLRGTPERIELENYRLSLQREEELEEVPEETLAEHNLSSVLDKVVDADLGSSSSESDTAPAGPSDLGGVPWKEAVELHAKLRGDHGGEEEEAGVDAVSRDGEYSSEELCEDEEAEAASPDAEPGTEVDQDDIPSDAEAEARVHQSECADGLPEDDGTSESLRMSSSTPKQPLSAQVSLMKPPGGRFFPEPFIPDEERAQGTTPSPSRVIKSPLDLAPLPVRDPSPACSPTVPVAVPSTPPVGVPASPSLTAQPLESPLVSPVKSPIGSPIRSQPTSLLESCTSKTPVYPHRSICPLTGNPLSPICSRSPPCQEPSTPITSHSPVRTQPGPGLTSTPLNKAEEGTRPDESSTLAKKTDIIEEFWLKSAEIRKSLGLTPLERSSKVLEKSVLKDAAPAKTQPPDASKEQKPAVIHRLNITLEGQVITPLVPEPKSGSSDKKYLSSSSGLGLNGSSAARTAVSDGYNTSDSAMLTPPSSPPPPVPANQSPAVLRQKKKHLEPQRVSTPPAETEAAPAVVMREKKKKPQPEEVRKSFVETVEEIPFADDVEESYDELHLALAMENGKPKIPASPTSRSARAVQFSPEAREIAEERIKAREQSVKSQALKDAMAKQLNKMRDAHPDQGVSPKVAWSVTPGKSKNNAAPPKTPAAKAPEPKKAETLPERFFSSNRSLDSSAASSDASSSSKSKKRSSLFSPRKNKKEKKAKNDGSRLAAAGETPPKHKSLWKAVFSGYKKDKKKKDEKSCPSTPSSSSTTQDSGKKKKASPPRRSSDLKASQNLSFSEDSDLSFDDVLEKSSQKSKPPKTYTEEELDAKLTRRVQRAIRRQAKQEELKRLHRAQIIQRQLEQVEEKQRQLEERGVAVEKALRGEAGMGKKDDPKLMQEWFKLVQEKNALVRYESELMIFARELELEDRQSRLQQELRERMAVEVHLKSHDELAKEKQILNETLEVVEHRNDLVALPQEQTLQEKEEDKDLEAVMLSKGLGLNWV